ncbi:hypothetical protein [Tautonia plasticadhaerens]|uniref:Uncharacterized protein n=1 Tax=Tautonia plasticadhaerens TaxID=2527974 RepID=A0A518H975_9BACT|nr:hypothetical protein [Tautonia plasticadhaerens]QDV37286.1 hypothetical protein ElP_52210 [Tautonia plasticadhaerens]
MDNGHENDHEHEHEEVDATELLQELGAESRTQIFLSMRQQNLELLEIAARVAGYSGEHGPMKGDESEKAMRTIWKLYSEFYSWIDPEEIEEDDEDGDE